MKRLLSLVLLLVITVAMSGCEKETLPIQDEDCNYKAVYVVEVVKELEENVYWVNRYEKEIFYQVYTEQELVNGDITRIAIYDNKDAVIFDELDCTNE